LAESLIASFKMLAIPKEQAPPEHFDVLILGSGEAGKYLSWHLASSHQRVALIERRYIGGSCPNIACLPSKNVIHSANITYNARKAAASGFFPSDVTHVDMAAVRQRKRDMVQDLVEMNADRFRKSGVELIMGTGRFVAPKTISVVASNGQFRKLSADTVIVSTGSRTRIDDNILGLVEANPLTHVEMLEVEVVPPHLIVLGGGYSGLEFAQAMRRLGSQVSIFERGSRILKHEDEDVSSTLTEMLISEGIEFHTSAAVQRVSGRSGKTVTVAGTQAGIPFETTGTHLLCATGRIPNTDNLGLEDAGVTLTNRGYVQVDEHLRSALPGFFAVGDCAGSPHFTHIAYDDFRIVRDFLAGHPRSTTSRQLPYTLFTSPELAHVGLNETEARRDGVPYRLAKLPMNAFLRTRTMDETEGFAKALISADNDTILGFTALGVSAGELLPAVQVAMKAGLPYTSIRDLVITHPTLCEGLVNLFSAVPGRS
jgi:pyruvate/2-oxoglutarate dehydrogenase complex dihydrolipoamide dehydrogenase (E3) component